MEKTILLHILLITLTFSFGISANAQTTVKSENSKTLSNNSLDKKVYGVITISVADIRVKPDFGAEMATQALLGTPIKIHQKDGWYRIETPDTYTGWTQAASFEPMTQEEFNAWTNAPKIIFTDYYGFSYQNEDTNGQTVSDLVNGNVLKLEGESQLYYRVSYPDSRTAYVLKSQSKRYNEWLETTTNPTGELIVKKAFTLMGIPYNWGGTSAKGVDCSGFTKIIYGMYGIILMRDASQQALTGISVDISKGYDNLQAGDLMFFGKKAEEGKKERIRHVAFYIGNKEFIHASGMVKVSSLDSTRTNYDVTNTKEFVRASRIIGAIGTPGIWSVSQNPLYRIQE